MAKYVYESLIEQGVMDERDVDYLEHLQVPEVEELDADTVVAMEGITRAVVHDAATTYTDAFREVKGWLLGIESKRKYVEEICVDLIDWLKDKDVDHKNLDLDMGTFKTWMKTSETFFWRFYFLLDDATWNKIERDLKSGKITELETLYDLNFKDRKLMMQELDSVDKIDILVKKVELYRNRSNKFFHQIAARRVKIKAFPFQVILLGAADLRRTCKKIVNLAI